MLTDTLRSIFGEALSSHIDGCGYPGCYDTGSGWVLCAEGYRLHRELDDVADATADLPEQCQRGTLPPARCPWCTRPARLVVAEERFWWRCRSGCLDPDAKGVYTFTTAALDRWVRRDAQDERRNLPS